jgi:four helix bundle protein
MAEKKGFEGLVVWQKAMNLAVEICQKTLPVLPMDEKYALTSQLRRYVQSIPANIAEGHGRYYYQEGIRYALIARGSLDETFNHLILAGRLGYLSDAQCRILMGEISEIRKLLSGYIAYLKQSKRGADLPLSSIRETEGPYFSESALQPPLSDHHISTDELLD